MQEIKAQLNKLLEESGKNHLDHHPLFFRLQNELDRKELAQLFKVPGIKVFDELHGQLRELVKSMHPKHKFMDKELDEAAKDYLGSKDTFEYGVWIYYPWLNKLVHTLDEKEYREVRTNRNQFKIMPEERDRLAETKIGVIGLSVGQSVAIALSMERSYGELRLADFDVLELSNLNRIRSGVQDLGHLKTVSTARQIAEIDPFLKVKCFHEGLSEENIDQFLTADGKLDLLIDECDGLDIKILARQRARALQIPVIMETSDRGMIDVERFDLEPDRSLLHGLIDHLEQDPSKLKGLTNEEKVPYLLPIIGLETMSDRLKASMLEIDQLITTWPQLASDVILGGAASANVCRRIALGEFNHSGRFFVDLNEIVSPEKAFEFKDKEEKYAVLETKFETKFKRLEPQEDQLELNIEQVNGLVESAILAPSGGNSQPWQFVYQNKNIYLLLDPSKGFSYLDQDKAGARAGLGAAAENLILKAHEMSLEVVLDEFPAGAKENPVGVFRFFEHKPASGKKVESHQFDSLVKDIGTRFTSRLIRKSELIDREILKKAGNYVQSIEGAKFHWLEKETEIKKIADLAGKIDRISLTNKRGHHDFINEIRWNNREAEAKKDGIDIASVDITAAEEAGFRVAKEWSVVETINIWGGGSGFEKLSRKSIEHASAVGLITMRGSEMSDFFNSGRALERMWLYANEAKLSLHPMTAITFMMHQLNNDAIDALSAESKAQLKQIKKEFYLLFNLGEDEYPILLFRAFIAEKPEKKSLRRPLKEVLKIVK